MQVVIRVMQQRDECRHRPRVGQHHQLPRRGQPPPRVRIPQPGEHGPHRGLPHPHQHVERGNTLVIKAVLHAFLVRAFGKTQQQRLDQPQVRQLPQRLLPLIALFLLHLVVQRVERRPGNGVANVPQRLQRRAGLRAGLDHLQQRRHRARVAQAAQRLDCILPAAGVLQLRDQRLDGLPVTEPAEGGSPTLPCPHTR